MNGPPDQPPKISIVIPVYNEEAILHAAVVDLRERLAPPGIPYEILLAENGSTDGTVRVAELLARRYPEVRHFSVGEPNYGKALRAGILDAVGEVVVCEEIDLCDVDFALRALAVIEEGADLVVGSKLIAGADDARPWLRHSASLVYTTLLRLCVGFQGTDTHGPKAFRRAAMLPVVRACVIDRDVFASELVIRAHRAGLAVKELPIRVMEKRPPSINLLRRVPNVLANLYRLHRAVRGQSHQTME